jgi:hypothetical protein
MKTRSPSPVARLRRRIVCSTLLGACLAHPARAADPAADEQKPVEEPAPANVLTNFNNWVELSVGHAFVNGNDAQFQQRYWLKEGTYGGIEDIHWQTAISSNVFLQIDGRAIFDNHDYGVRLELFRPEVGFVRGGYKQFRTWYDGSGGFIPGGLYYELQPDDVLALDRGEAWFEAGLTLEHLPQLTFKYSHQFRDGEKSSTSWGFAHPFGGSVVRAISPAFWDVDQTRDIFEFDAKHTIKKTDLGLGLHYEATRQDDALKYRQWPGEDFERHLTQRNGLDYDLFNVHATSETHFNEKTLLTAGFLFSSLDSDLSGSRVYGDDYDVNYNPTLAQGLGFFDLTGGSQLNEYVGSLNFMFSPVNHLTLVPSVRVLKNDLDSTSAFFQTGAPGVPDSSVAAYSQREFLDVTERFEARYTGVTNWVFYARGDWMQGQGDLRETGGVALGLPVARYTEDDRFVQRYTVGANWYPLTRLNLDTQYYHKTRNNDYDHESDSTPNNGFDRYPACLVAQDFDTDDVSVRLTWRPLRRLSLVTRYDFQYSTVYTRPDPAADLGGTEAAQMTSHIIAQNVTLTPWSRLYLQAGVNYVVSDTDTRADDYTRAILDSENNYWTLSLTAGFALDKKTDLQAHYFYYNADNYVDISQYGVPYGVGAEEHGVTVSLTRRLRDNIRLNARYGYFTYDDESSGGYNDYDAHLIYASLQYAF